MLTLLTVTALADDRSVVSALDCEPNWERAIGQPGLNSWAYSVVEFSGDVIAGGIFATADGKDVNHIARWDGSAWHPYTLWSGEIGVNHWVRHLLEYDGDLVAAGHFTMAGDKVVNGIARWDGLGWHAFQSSGQIGVGGNNPWIGTATIFQGDLIVAGSFDTAGGQVVNYIARWDGAAWHPLVSGDHVGVDYVVRALTVYNGDLVAGGHFITAGGTPAYRIARWDGTTWHPFTSGGHIGVGVSGVYALTVYNGDLIAGGAFNNAGGQTVNRIARWDGSAWHPFDAGGQVGVDGDVHSLHVYNDNLIVGGKFITAGGQTVNRIAQWDGASWHPFASGGSVGLGGGEVYAATDFNGDLVVAGAFANAGGESAGRIVVWGGCGDNTCPWDFNGDGVVDGADLGQLLAHWGACSDCGDCPWDVTGDCIVDGADLGQLLANWGECP